MLRRVSGCAVVCALFLLPAGCATSEGGGGPNVSGIFGSADATIPVSAAEQQLREDNRVFNKTILGGAATGAVAGILVGAVLGAMTGKAENIAYGAAAGGVVGGIGGALDGWRVAKKQEAARQQIREIDLVTREVEAENARIAQSIRNVDLVIADTQRSLRSARSAYQRGEASIEEVRAQERRAERNIKQMDELIGNMDERNQDYAEIAEALRKEGEESKKLDRDIEQTRAVLSKRKQVLDLMGQELVQGRIG